MVKRQVMLIFAICGCANSLKGAENAEAARGSLALEIRSVSVDSNSVVVKQGSETTLPPFFKSLVFGFGPSSRAALGSTRLRYKLDGFDSNWRETGGGMTFTVRFYDAAGDQISQKVFEVTGESPGWRGMNSPLTHRRESLPAPEKASRVLVVISSAGPPAAVGIYVVDGLEVSRLKTNGAPEVILRFPFDRQRYEEYNGRLLEGWMRDGMHPSMARIVELTGTPPTRAFAVLDDDPTGHAEWHNTIDRAPAVAPGDSLVIEWNEMFSVGMGNTRLAHYDSIPAGKYKFRVAEVSAVGEPTGAEATLAVVVPLPFWNSLWFQATAVALFAILLGAIVRYVIRQRMRVEMMRLEQQHALEQERLRIAHDIHDDLGARVTQISLFSAMEHHNPLFPEKARASFDQISRMSRELVSALYETVWAVNPENDNLDALGSHLCQIVNQLCEQGNLRCRLHLEELPREIQISSQTRHNISLATKEAVHNIIKHARASEVTVRIGWGDPRLEVSIQDDGNGFEIGDNAAGNGLPSMKRRLEKIGGSCSIESAPSRGTTVRLVLNIAARDVEID
jgi:signal transduction histidine kinase